MVVPLATDMPFNFDNPIAWKLLNQRSTASRSSSLQRSRISLCRTWRTSGSITKLYAIRFWRFPFEGLVGLITERCAKCFCSLVFEHNYPGLKVQSRVNCFLRSKSQLCFELVSGQTLEVLEIGLLHHLCRRDPDFFAV